MKVWLDEWCEMQEFPSEEDVIAAFDSEREWINSPLCILKWCGIQSMKELFELLPVDALTKILMCFPEELRWCARHSTCSQKVYFRSQTKIDDPDVWMTPREALDLIYSDSTNADSTGVPNFSLLSSEDICECILRGYTSETKYRSGTFVAYETTVVPVLERHHITAEKIISDGVAEMCVKHSNDVLLGQLVLRYPHCAELLNMYAAVVSQIREENVEYSSAEEDTYSSSDY